MDTNERRQNEMMAIDKNAQIQLVLNTNDNGDYEINLVRIFHRMKRKRRLYAWVLALCVFLGICAPLLLYQFTKPMLTVSSVVTLNYETEDAYLAAPDGTELDLSQVFSSYVLQNAVRGLELSVPITISQLRANLNIMKVLTEETRQKQEIAAKMTEDKSNEAYASAGNIEMKYEKKFVVSLTNGFGDEDSRVKKVLTDAELRLILDRILDAYNDYLVLTYADLKLPDDNLSVIDVEALDILESLDLLRSASDNLYSYCSDKPESIRSYRSAQTGRSLNDWMETLQTNLEVGINYLYSYVYTNCIVKNRDSMLINYQYQLRNTKTQLDSLDENIETISNILKNYKNDEIFVTMQESDTSKSTTTTTDYYNRLILSQASNYLSATEIKIKIADLEEKIAIIASTNDESSGGLTQQEEIMVELNKNLETSRYFYNKIKAHMEEVIASSFFTNFASHTSPQGKTDGFIKSNLLKAIIGAVAGGVIGCGLWFMSSVIPELILDERKRRLAKEASAS